MAAVTVKILNFRGSQKKEFWEFHQPSYSGNQTYDYEEKYAPDPMGDQAKPNARVWKVYLDESESYDEDMLRSFRDTIDALLVFKQNEEIYLALISGFLQSDSDLPKVLNSQKLTAAMVRAASHGGLALLKQFVDWGVDLNHPDMTAPAHPTALGDAAQAVMEYLLNQGANPNSHDHILDRAVIEGLEAVELLIDKGANLQAQGQSALETASRQGNLDIAKLLIETGVNPRNEGGNALQEACLRASRDCEASCQEWWRCQCSGRSLLTTMLSVELVVAGNSADTRRGIARYFSLLFPGPYSLLRSQPVLRRDSGDYRTALLAAIQGGESDVVKFLIESGADVNASAGDFETPPQTPLQLAIQKGHKEIEKILRRHGARE
ncbi:ankyrin repeat-containing domain protein [Mycena floridula]|nr:ankyrin repeat-containing domain protein [Mycena floridula]